MAVNFPFQIVSLMVLAETPVNFTFSFELYTSPKRLELDNKTFLFKLKSWLWGAIFWYL